jgi:uncharacterized membrane protein
MIWGFQGAAEMLNLHPIFVHFPVALLTTSFLAYLFGWVLRKEELQNAGKWMLYFGTLAAGLAVWSGLQAEASMPHPAEVHDILTAHENLGYVILGLSALLSLWSLVARRALPQKGRGLFLAVLAFLTLVIAQTGDFGGRMVYFHGVGMGRKSEVKASAPSLHEHVGTP